MEKLFGLLALVAFAVLWTCYQNWVHRDKDDKGPEMTGHATVKGHRVVQGGFMGKATSRWNYMMTFALSDGEEIELYVTDDIFATLTVGQSGQLTWQGKRFYHFDSDI